LQKKYAEGMCNLLRRETEEPVTSAQRTERKRTIDLLPLFVGRAVTTITDDAETCCHHFNSVGRLGGNRVLRVLGGFDVLQLLLAMQENVDGKQRQHQ